MDSCEYVASKCSLNWFGPPASSSNVIGWKPPNKQANRGWTEKEGSGLAGAPVPLGSRWGPTGVPRVPCCDWSIWRRFRRRRCFTRHFTSCGLSLRTILLLLIVAVPFPLLCDRGYVCVSEPGSCSLFCRSAANPLAGNLMSAGGRWSKWLWGRSWKTWKNIISRPWYLLGLSGKVFWENREMKKSDETKIYFSFNSNLSAVTTKGSLKLKEC